MKMKVAQAGRGSGRGHREMRRTSLVAQIADLLHVRLQGVEIAKMAILDLKGNRTAV